MVPISFKVCVKYAVFMKQSSPGTLLIGYDMQNDYLDQFYSEDHAFHFYGLLSNCTSNYN